MTDENLPTSARPAVIDASLATPPARGLFDPKREFDACGVGFIVDLKSRSSHQIVQDALSILENLEHRGAVGADPLSGDGAGILIQVPHQFLNEECAALGIIKLEAALDQLLVQFEPNPSVDPVKIIKLIQSKREYQLAGQDKLLLRRHCPSLAEKLSAVRDLIGQLA